jgi:hypothetical protein
MRAVEIVIVPRPAHLPFRCVERMFGSWDYPTRTRTWFWWAADFSGALNDLAGDRLALVCFALNALMILAAPLRPIFDPCDAYKEDARSMAPARRTAEAGAPETRRAA